MLTVAYIAFAVIQLALAVWAIRLYLKRPSVAAFTVALPIALLVWDNAVVAVGAMLGEGSLLAALSYPRFLGHALLTPIWIVTGFEYARRVADGRMRTRVWCVGEWGLYALMAALGFLKSVVLLDMATVRQADLLYYTNVGGFPGPPVPALVMVVVVTAAGVFVWRRTGWPWMLAGGIAMFIAAAVPTSLVGFWLSNTGEVLLSAALVGTEAFLQKRSG